MFAGELGVGSLCITGPCLPGLTMAAGEGQTMQKTGRCNPLWEELETGLWKKLLAGYSNWAWQPFTL